MFKLFILLYYVFSAVYSFSLLRRKKENGLIKVLLINFLPVAGVVLTLYLFKPVKSSASHQAVETGGALSPIDLEETASVYHSIDIESEINLVPIQDALLLNENRVKRKLLIHSLKENSIQNPMVLEKALQSDDSETSHYAATAIMEMKRKLMNSIQELAAQLEENPEDAQILMSYEEVINRYLRSGFLDEGTYKQYQYLHSEILEKILLSGQSQKQHYIDKINCDLALKEYETAKYHSEKFINEYPYEEKAYILAMKLHYNLRNSGQLQSILTTLRKQPVRLSADGLRVIRFWLQEEKSGL
ncbi:hypothetical protein BABA_11051 [Neobacillus bataviensis LMG 21833]|uniref:Uncharacterized protein n=1 Tax=Neobacillus bataviensis LMG 21833 TaxID=1117379 RepID=K6D9N5_9BACI|nr:hypothetical protein [Neobacillus bataviensis]EKN69247.1 hypothetical protein BABA_11051 [Neobacillus bataviensis LMG 21833]